MSTYQLFATTPKAMETILAEELHSIGINNIKATMAGVAFQGDLEIAYRVCRVVDEQAAQADADAQSLAGVQAGPHQVGVVAERDLRDAAVVHLALLHAGREFLDQRRATLARRSG